MTYRVAINGYGRIGQSVLRALYERRATGAFNDIQIVAINELSDIDTVAYLTRYDTTHGRFPQNVEVASKNQLSVASDLISFTRHDSIEQLPWRSGEIDLVLECTGAYGKRREADRHIESGSQRVLLSQPADIDVDDEQLLIQDTHKAVQELEQDNIFSYCISLDPNADEYVSDIFGNQHLVIDNINKLPEKLPALFASLTI